MRLPELAAVAIGGMAGTALRLGVDVLLPDAEGGFPVGTFLVNVAGSFALALLVARMRPEAPGWLRAGLGPGLLGAFTTFSAIALATTELVRAATVEAIVYPVASLAGGLSAAAAGLVIGRRRGRLEEGA